MKIIDNYIEGSGIEHKITENKGGVFANGMPDTIIIHYTAGPNASSAVNTFLDTSAKVSAHIVVD